MDERDFCFKANSIQVSAVSELLIADC